MLKQTNVIIRNKRVIAKKIGGEFIVLDANTGRLYRLNPTAEFVWKCLSKPRSLHDIVESITSEFLVDKQAATKDISLFIQTYLGKLFFVSVK